MKTVNERIDDLQDILNELGFFEIRDRRENINYIEFRTTDNNKSVGVDVKGRSINIALHNEETNTSDYQIWPLGYLSLKGMKESFIELLK